MKPNDPLGPGVTGLTSLERRVAALVAAGQTYAEAAAEIGKTEVTVKRMMARVEVRKAVDDIRNAAIESGLGELCAGFRGAVRELTRITREGTNADSVRLGAARCVIESVLKVREQVEMVRRIEALEAAEAARGVKA